MSNLWYYLGVQLIPFGNHHPSKMCRKLKRNTENVQTFNAHGKCWNFASIVIKAKFN